MDEANAHSQRVEAELAALRRSAAAAPAQLLLELKTAAEAASAFVEIDEADTRRIVDAKLRSAGWTVDTDTIRHASGAKPSDAEAIAIAEWPTEDGRVDYALFLKGRCVGVIEAKRQSKDVPSVLEQAKRYAETIEIDPSEMVLDAPVPHGLEKPFLRVPFVFATNGRPYVKQLATKSGIWFWDPGSTRTCPRRFPSGSRRLTSRSGLSRTSRLPKNSRRSPSATPDCVPIRSRR